MPYFGEPYGYLHSKPPKWAVETPPAWDEKRHFQPSDYDLLEKERLAARRFGHVRHQVYKNVLEPSASALGYASEHERLRKDVEASTRLDHLNSQSRKKEILESHKVVRAEREIKARNQREDEWRRSLLHESWCRTQHPHARVLANRTSVPYDPITLKYHDGYEGERAKYNDAAARWRGAMRSIRIYRKMNGDKNYDVISWEPLPRLVHPEKPTPPLLREVEPIEMEASQKICKDVLVH